MDEDKKLLLNEIEGMITDSQKENVKKSDVEARLDAINKKIEGLNETELKQLKVEVDALAKKNEELLGIVEKQGLEINKANEGAKKAEPKSLRQIMKDAILEKKEVVLTEKNDDWGKRLSLKEWFTEKGNQNTPSFILKDAVDMLESNIVQNYVSTIRLTELDPNRVGVPLTIYPHVISTFPKKRIMKPNMALLVVYTYVDGTGTKTEGSAPGKSSFLFKTVSFPAFNISTYFTLSDETLDDLEEALDEINTVAPDKINDKIDTYILGTTGNDSTAIGGLFSDSVSKHTMIDVTAPYATSIENATIVDLIATAKLQVENSKYRPDQVWLSPFDVLTLAALKNAIEDSVMDRRVSFDVLGNPVAVVVLVTPSVPATTVLPVAPATVKLPEPMLISDVVEPTKSSPAPRLMWLLNVDSPVTVSVVPTIIAPLNVRFDVDKSPPVFQAFTSTLLTLVCWSAPEAAIAIFKYLYLAAVVTG